MVSRICSGSLLISCAIIEVFLSRIFQNLDLGREWILSYTSMEQQLQILEALHIRIKKNQLYFENGKNILKCVFFFFNISYSLIIFYFR